MLEQTFCKARTLSFLRIRQREAAVLLFSRLKRRFSRSSTDNCSKSKEKNYH